MKKTHLSRGSRSRWPKSLALAVPVGVVSLCLLLAFASPAFAASAPAIESISASNITASDATLEAQINPGGLDTSYHFHLTYGCGTGPEPEMCPMYCTPNEGCAGPREVPLPTIELSASSEPQTVRLNLSEAGVTLQPATRYRYSVAAANSEGGTESANQYFTTPSTSAPTIESEAVTHINPTDALLEAQINPNGQQTSYHFRLLSGCFSFHATCMWMHEDILPGGEIAASTEGQRVSADIHEAGLTLHPGYEYIYSVEATNEAGTTQGAEQRFATGGSPVVESESVSHITDTDATLEATINPEGLETTYKFLLGEDEPPCLEASPPCMIAQRTPRKLGGGTLSTSAAGANIGLDLNSTGVTLAPGVEYTFWIYASNATGSTLGRHVRFRTSSGLGGRESETPEASPLNVTTGRTPQASITVPSRARSGPPHHRLKHHRRPHRWRYRRKHR